MAKEKEVDEVSEERKRRKEFGDETGGGSRGEALFPCGLGPLCYKGQTHGRDRHSLRRGLETKGRYPSRLPFWTVYLYSSKHTWLKHKIVQKSRVAMSPDPLSTPHG